LAAEKQENLKLKYEAKTRSLEQKLKERSQLLSTIQEGVPSGVFGSRLATEREMFEQESIVGEFTVQTMAATPSFDTMENPNCIHSVLTTSPSPVYTQSLLQGPPPLFTPYLLNARHASSTTTFARANDANFGIANYGTANTSSCTFCLRVIASRWLCGTTTQCCSYTSYWFRD